MVKSREDFGKSLRMEKGNCMGKYATGKVCDGMALISERKFLTADIL